MLDGNRSLPYLMIQNFIKINIVVLIATKWVSNNVCHRHQGKYDHHLHHLNKEDIENISDDLSKDLKPWNSNQYPESHTMTQGKVLSTKDPQDEPGVDGPHQCLAVYEGERVVLVF